MSDMKALYEKVAKDATLQDRFNQVLIESKQAGQEKTEEKLIAFAKDAGFEITLSELQDFFSGLEEPSQGELSEAELDIVAGGKSTSETAQAIALSITIIGCVIMRSVNQNSTEGYCEI